MKPLSNSRDVYKLILEELDDESVYGLLAFSLIEQQRFEWMERVEETTEAIPTDDEIRNWYSQQPERVIIKAKEDAQNKLANLFFEFYNIEMQEDLQNYRDSMVIEEVNKINVKIETWGKFWPQFLPNVGLSVINFFVFTILTIISIIVVHQLNNDLSLIEVIRDLFQEG